MKGLTAPEVFIGSPILNNTNAVHYSLGALLYFLLHGYPPPPHPGAGYTGRFPEMSREVLRNVPVDILSAVVMLMRLDPESRPPLEVVRCPAVWRRWG